MEGAEGIFWYPGLRKMQPTPWVYKIPPLYFLKGEIKPTEKPIINYERIRAATRTTISQKNAGGLF